MSDAAMESKPMTTDERIEHLADWLLACHRAGSLDRLVLVTKLSEFVDEATANEQADIGMLSDNLTRVYEHFAGVTKPMTDPEEVIRIAEERRSREVDETWNEALEEAAKVAESRYGRPLLPAMDAPSAKTEAGARIAAAIREIKEA